MSQSRRWKRLLGVCVVGMALLMGTMAAAKQIIGDPNKPSRSHHGDDPTATVTLTRSEKIARARHDIQEKGFGDRAAICEQADGTISIIVSDFVDDKAPHTLLPDGVECVWAGR